MVKLKAKGSRWLKSFHLVAVSCWIGGAVSLILLYFIKAGINDGGTLYGINRSIHHVDIAVVVIPGAFGCLATGLVYSLFTNWGFFRHGWLIYKWIITVAAILFWTFFLGPWETEMMRISGRITKTGRMVLSSPAVMKRQDWNGFISLSFPAILPVPPTMNAPSPTFPTAVFEAPPCSMKKYGTPVSGKSGMGNI